MSTFEATIHTRAEYDALFANWPFWAILRPDAYDYGAFTQEGELICVPCALDRLDRGEADHADIFTIEQPQSAGEYCPAHHDYFIEPFCRECGTAEAYIADDLLNPLMYHEAGEHAICRRCYLLGVLRGTLGLDLGRYGSAAHTWMEVP